MPFKRKLIPVLACRWRGILGKKNCCEKTNRGRKKDFSSHLTVSPLAFLPKHTFSLITYLSLANASTRSDLRLGARLTQSPPIPAWPPSSTSLTSVVRFVSQLRIFSPARRRSQFDALARALGFSTPPPITSHLLRQFGFNCPFQWGLRVKEGFFCRC